MLISDLMDKLYSFLERKTESYLTHKKAVKATLKAEKHGFWAEVWSWLDAFVFAIVAVLLINQFLFQLFVIPSPSMVDTINVGDRVVVSKMSYGTEVYPAGPKIFDSSKRVQRDDIITFYNPEYESKGPLFDILSQIVYMGTLSLVNIDRNPDGTMAERLFVKRASGFGSDQVYFEDGNVLIRPAGYGESIDEQTFRSENGYSDAPSRLLDSSYYPGLQAWARLYALQDAGMTSAPNHLISSYQEITGSQVGDLYEFSKERYLYSTLIDPSDRESRSSYSRYRAGIYVPEGYVLPLGDNRDNSRDGRYFGPVSEDVINGKVLFRFWPLNRAGAVE